MSNKLETTYHNALRRILIALRETAPILVVLNKDLEVAVEMEEVKPAARRYSKPCLEYAKPEVPAAEQSFCAEDENAIFAGKIISFTMTREDACVCFGEKCHEKHMMFTPDNSLTPVWMNVSA